MFKLVSLASIGQHYRRQNQIHKKNQVTKRSQMKQMLSHPS